MDEPKAPKQKKIETIKMRVTLAQKAKLNAYKKMYRYPSLTALILDWMMSYSPKHAPIKKKEGERAKPSRPRTNLTK